MPIQAERRTPAAVWPCCGGVPAGAAAPRGSHDGEVGSPPGSFHQPSSWLLTSQTPLPPSRSSPKVMEMTAVTARVHGQAMCAGVPRLHLVVMMQLPGSVWGLWRSGRSC